MFNDKTFINPSKSQLNEIKEIYSRIKNILEYYDFKIILFSLKLTGIK